MTSSRHKFSNRAAIAALLFCMLVPGALFAQNAGVYKYPSEKKVERQVDSVFRKLSTREKIAQIMIIEFDSKDGKLRKAMQNRLVKKEKIGGLIPMNDDLIPAMKRMNELNRLAKVPMLISIDAEWGANMRYWDEIPPFPRQMQLGALSSDSLVYRMGYLMGKECRLLKMQVNYAPDIDINNNPSNPAINTRSFGEDKEKVARYGIAIMKGMKDAGVAGSAKHFPGHGDTDVDSHLALPVIPFDYTRLDTLEMYPFKRLIPAGVDMVMVAHLNIPALDSSGTPSSISRPIVTGLLREKLGFKGIICTDALNMHGVAKESGLEKKEIPLAAYKAGADILLMPEDVENSIDMIEHALKRGEITMEGLDKRVKKMLALKARLGVFDKGYDPIVDIESLERLTDQKNPDKVMTAKMNLIKEVSKKTITVLFNDNSANCGLPVSFEGGKKVAYVGFRNPELGREFGVLANRYGQVDTLILGDDATLESLKEAQNKLRNHDLVIFGFNQTDQSPVRKYGVVPEEIEFITGWAAQQPMIAVYLGSPYAVGLMQGHKYFSAFVVGYANTQANNFAAVQAVFGGIPATGVMPVSVASFNEGESVVIPERFREEYDFFVGTEEDSLNLVQYDMKGKSPLVSLLPSVVEFEEGGKSVEEVLNDKFRQMGMRSTVFKDGSLVTTGYDYNKFLFTLKNGGKYAGKQVFSPQTAKFLLENL